MQHKSLTFNYRIVVEPSFLSFKKLLQLSYILQVIVSHIESDAVKVKTDFI